MTGRPICPICGSEAKESETKFGIRHDCCGLWSWNGAPLVNRETHKARVTAHAAFDRLWRSGLMKRSDAYKALADKLNVARKECHIKMMSAEMASRIPDIAKEIARALS